MSTVAMDLGCWIETASGMQFSLSRPQASMVSIEDIAHALGNLCRFVGHTPEFYSVAQHSVIVADLVRTPTIQLAALLHDAHEAYIGDFSRPMKELLGECGMSIRGIEGDIQDAIHQRFGVTVDAITKRAIKEADNKALAVEAWNFMPSKGSTWTPPAPCDGFHIMALSPKDASEAFLDRFRRYSKS